MGILDKLFGKAASRAQAPAKPDAIAVEADPTGVYAPCDGELVHMADLPDPVFASGAMGVAVGVKPSRGTVYSPVSGTITVTTGTLHALGVRSDAGIDILIHVGVDTVNMKGEGFYGFVEQGQHVAAGEPLMVADLPKIAEAGYDDTVIVVVINTDEYASVTPATTGPVTAGEQVMAVEA